MAANPGVITTSIGSATRPASGPLNRSIKGSVCTTAMSGSSIEGRTVNPVIVTAMAGDSVPAMTRITANSVARIGGMAGTGSGVRTGGRIAVATGGKTGVMADMTRRATGAVPIGTDPPETAVGFERAGSLPDNDRPSRT